MFSPLHESDALQGCFLFGEYMKIDTEAMIRCGWVFGPLQNDGGIYWCLSYDGSVQMLVAGMLLYDNKNTYDVDVYDSTIIAYKAVKFPTVHMKGK